MHSSSEGTVRTPVADQVAHLIDAVTQVIGQTGVHLTGETLAGQT
jgi:hypothetical protein